jgi:hypothetical protein
LIDAQSLNWRIARGGKPVPLFRTMRWKHPKKNLGSSLRRYGRAPLRYEWRPPCNLASI